MSESKRSFFATIPGLVTGLAGLLTGVVGLVTVLIQLGVIGDDSGDKSTTTTTAPGSATGGGPAGGGGATAGTEVPAFTVSPSNLDFKVTDPREKSVTVKNTSDAARLTALRPQVTGPDANQFSVDAGGCARPLAAGLSCTLKVTFSPSGALRSYNATLQVTAAGGARGQEVLLTASTLL